MYHLSRIMYYFGWLLAFGYTATCTVILFASHVPSSAWWLPLLVIAFFEYGMVKWINYHKHNAESAWQFYISLIMTISCAVAICLSSALQTLIWLGVSMPTWIIFALECYLVGNMCANVLALVGVSLTHPAHMQQFAYHQSAQVKDVRTTHEKLYGQERRTQPALLEKTEVVRTSEDDEEKDVRTTDGKHPKDCYCTTCRPKVVRTSRKLNKFTTEVSTDAKIPE